MTEEGATQMSGTVVRGDAVEPYVSHWGGLKWLANQRLIPDAEQSFAINFINPGRHNPLHYHPNCDELLYVLAGECDHRVGDDVLHLKPGDLLHVPQGLPHNATCTSWEPLRAVVSCSSGDRQTVTLEGDERL